MKQPNDIVNPDELVEYIQSRNVSEAKATGLKLMRRAADTIAWQDSELRRLQSEDPLDQVVHALGADFHEKHPDGYDLHDVLQHIEDLHVQLVGLQDGIIQRDQVIADYEQPVTTGPASGIEIKFAEGPSTDDVHDPDKSVSYGDTMGRHEWIKEATVFAHKVHGITLAMPPSPGMLHLQSIAEHIINKSPAN